MIEYGHFIGGKRVAGTSGRKQDVMQPMDGTVRGTRGAGFARRNCARRSRTPRRRRPAGPPPTRSAACAC